MRSNEIIVRSISLCDCQFVISVRIIVTFHIILKSKFNIKELLLKNSSEKFTEGGFTYEDHLRLLDKIVEELRGLEEI